MPWPFSFAEPDFDPGPTNSTTALQALTAAAVRIEGIWVTNDTDQEQTVTLEDGSANPICPEIHVGPRGFVEIEVAFIKRTGISHKSSSNSGVQVEVWGYTV